MANRLSMWSSEMRSRYRALDRRDRLALGALIAFLGGLVLIYGIWLPTADFHATQQAERTRQLELLQFMRSTEQEARTLGEGQAALPMGQDLLTQVSRSAREFGVNPNRLQPEGGDSVSVWFDGVPFNDLIRWLEAEAELGIGIRQVSIDRSGEPGRVSARIVLRR